jgi:hypothetical protein
VTGVQTCALPICTQIDVSETLSEGVSHEADLNESVSPMMGAYLQTLSRVAKK